MAKRRMGGIGRLVFLLVGVALLVLTALLWLNYLVKPGRALVQGQKTTVTVTHCDTTGKRHECYAAWHGRTPGGGVFTGEAKPGQQATAYVYRGEAYGTAFHDWTGRAVLGLVGLGFAVVARFLLVTGLRGRS
jgi:hypothetical protein